MTGQSLIMSALEVVRGKSQTDRLFWISDSSPPRNKLNSYFFCVDEDLVYEPFCSDFGPLNLGLAYQFCSKLERLLADPRYLSHHIYHYTSLDPAKKVNAAYLMGVFQIIILGRTAEEAWQCLAQGGPYVDFRDASYGGCTYRCSMLHCLRGLQKARSLGWFDYRTFNLEEYQFYEKVENGDFNWIVPPKLLAFSSPSDVAQDAEGWRTFTPEDYVPLFKRLGVTAVVRLNQKTYEAERFVRLGIRHYDLYFVDGSVPTESIVRRFLDIVENEPGGVAVHCKAGLGRTGTLIACYAMKHFQFPAADFIGWVRIARPGSVLGPQQQFLLETEAKCFRWAQEGSPKRPIRGPSEKVLMSPEDRVKAVHGDLGQANRLLSAKRSNQGSPISPPLKASPEKPVQKSPFAPAPRATSQGPVSHQPTQRKTDATPPRASVPVVKHSPVRPALGIGSQSFMLRSPPYPRYK